MQNQTNTAMQEGYKSTFFLSLILLGCVIVHIEPYPQQKYNVQKLTTIAEKIVYATSETQDKL